MRESEVRGSAVDSGGELVGLDRAVAAFEEESNSEAAELIRSAAMALPWTEGRRAAWVLGCIGALKSTAEPEIVALFGVNLFAHREALKAAGFVFWHWRTGYGYFRGGMGMDAAREALASLEESGEIDGGWELVRESSAPLSPVATAAAQSELVLESAGTDYLVKMKGSTAIQIKRGGRVAATVKNHLTARKWVWIMRGRRESAKAPKGDK